MILPAVQPGPLQLGPGQGHADRTDHRHLDPALTVIYGASDTGKSFIVESIDYMLGGTRTPEVPEAEGYSQILLGLRLPGGPAVVRVDGPVGRPPTPCGPIPRRVTRL
ncbi:hypothetical protein [Streptomyces sp. NRRL S-1022]|uniref:hypothetical protein n=1 Tax=Streptomyces sp. NRRL S-1022 TaxID=1463880 RepID=UPI0004BEE6EB|nr:hypothetical protein [Streptomyces sp. NRRL S-1022]